MHTSREIWQNYSLGYLIFVSYGMIFSFILEEWTVEIVCHVPEYIRLDLKWDWIRSVSIPLVFKHRLNSLCCHYFTITLFVVIRQANDIPF